MLNKKSQWRLGSPARRIHAGLWMFFAGAVALFSALLAQVVGATRNGADALADRLPGWPTFFVPETAAGYTVAATLVCWGVWAMGTGLKAARGAGR